MNASKLTQSDYNRKSRAKLGLKQKAFSFDAATIELLERLAAERGISQTAVVKMALAALDKETSA